MEKRIAEMCNVPDKILALLQSDVAEIKVALLGNEYNPQWRFTLSSYRIRERGNAFKRTV